jgi:hypothetical protein
VRARLYKVVRVTLGELMRSTYINLPLSAGVSFLAFPAAVALATDMNWYCLELQSLGELGDPGSELQHTEYIIIPIHNYISLHCLLILHTVCINQSSGAI